MSIFEDGKLNLFDLSGDLSKQQGQKIFEDNCFVREQRKFNLSDDIKLDIMTDHLKSAGIYVHHISLCFSRSEKLQFVAGNRPNLAESEGFLFRHEQRLLWLPKRPVARDYDSHGRIANEKLLDFESVETSEDIILSISAKEQCRIEFPVIVFADNGEMFLDEINTASTVENQHVFKGLWFDYKGINDLWNYFINGLFYSPVKGLSNKYEQSQQCPYTLFYYFTYLHRQTNKQIYKFFCDILAYAAMLSLPENGRWQHGSWTEIMETHAAYQISGIHLFLFYYEQTKNEIFLEKAKLAMSYLISMADELSDDGIWFLHDSLERNPEDASLYYKKLIPSGHFGKSLSNTLCLNTHIGTLTVLFRLKNLCPDSDYDTYFQSGLETLKRVLTSRPAAVIYLPLYLLRDSLAKFTLKTEWSLAKKIQLEYDRSLRVHILPRLKIRFPRLYMPNGFIERDLAYSHLSIRYHTVTLKDLLVLYKQIQQPWLLEIVKHSMSYSVKSKFAENYAFYDRRGAMFLDVLSLYSNIVEQKYLDKLLYFKDKFTNMSLPLPVDSISSPFLD